MTIPNQPMKSLFEVLEMKATNLLKTETETKFLETEFEPYELIMNK
jgi:hypothetical protein